MKPGPEGSRARDNAKESEGTWICWARETRQATPVETAAAAGMRVDATLARMAVRVALPLCVGDEGLRDAGNMAVQQPRRHEWP